MKDLITQTLHHVSYGVYIVSSLNGDRMNGLIVNTVAQVSSNPKKISVCISKKNFTHDYISESGLFSVSILEKDTPLKFIGPWGFKSGRDIDKFQDINYRRGKTGVPIVLDHTVGYIEGELTEKLDVGSHTIFVGRIVDAEKIGDQEPLTYSYYKDVKGGRASKEAPTFVDWKIIDNLE